MTQIEKVKRLPFIFLILISGLLLILSLQAYSQEIANIYSARGYWLEQNRENYRNLKFKREKGDSLTLSEALYLKDYEVYLKSYYTRMADEEKSRYLQYKEQWDGAFIAGDDRDESVFEWRPRDRFLNGAYGFWYGATLVAIMETESAAAVGIPFVTSGLWLLGPSIMPDRYENITRNTVRLSNTGKLFGLGYGASLGVLLVNENSDNGYKTILGLSSLGSIALGEMGFQYQMKRNLSAGHISMLRHYGILGGWVGLASAISLNAESSRIYGGMMLAGGITGILIGNQQAISNNFSSGDVNSIGSVTLTATGLGLAVATEIMYNMEYGYNENAEWPMIIPAATSILGTVLGQRQVRNVHLSKKQGSTLNLATAGGGLIGLGLVAIIESESPAVYIGLPSGLALLTHQVMFNKYKKENLSVQFEAKLSNKQNWNISLDIEPENYFANQNMNDMDDYYSSGEFNSPKSIVKLKLKF